MRDYCRTFAWGVVALIAVAAACWTALQIAGLPRQAHTAATTVFGGGFGVLVVVVLLFLSAPGGAWDDDGEADDDA